MGVDSLWVWVGLAAVSVVALVLMVWAFFRHRSHVAAEEDARRLAQVHARADRRRRRAERAQEKIMAIRNPRPGLERRPVVMVVDDSDTFRQSVRKILEEEDYRVLVAEHGRAAWDLLQEQRPDMIISDIDMPHLDGFGLLNLIRGDLKLADVPMVLMTSHIDVDVQVGPKTGVDGFLPKPFEPQDILEQVRFVLNE